MTEFALKYHFAYGRVCSKIPLCLWQSLIVLRLPTWGLAGRYNPVTNYRKTNRFQFQCRTVKIPAQQENEDGGIREWGCCWGCHKTFWSVVSDAGRWEKMEFAGKDQGNERSDRLCPTTRLSSSWCPTSETTPSELFKASMLLAGWVN